VTNVTHSTLVSNVSLILAAVLIASTNVSVHYQARSNFFLVTELKKDATASFLFFFSLQTELCHSINDISQRVVCVSGLISSEFPHFVVIGRITTYAA